MSAKEPLSSEPARLVNGGTLFFLALAIASGIAAYLMRGGDGVGRAMGEAGWLVVSVLPQLAAGLLLGGLARELVPEETVARLLGGSSGLGGLALASVVGALTPGGPFTSFPLVYALWVAGADMGALVAYVSAWSLIGINRLLIWELPFLGFDLAMLRLVACLPLPILAGLIARRLVRIERLRPDRPT